MAATRRRACLADRFTTRVIPAKEQPLSNPPPPTIDLGPHKEDPSGITESAPPPEVPTGLGDRAARGAVWSMIQLMASKVVSIVALLVLSWLVGSQDYGYVGLVYGVAAFVNLIQQAGIRDVLIQRGQEFEKWAAPAFWLSLLMGFLSTLVMFAAAPVAAWFFNDLRI